MGETIDVEVTREDASKEYYSVESGDETILKFVKQTPSSTDSNKIIWQFQALKGGNTEVKLSTENANYNGKSLSIFVGDGKTTSPFYVRNTVDLTAVTSTDKQGKSFKQVADISLKDVNWIPQPFSGIYDGNGHAVMNLKLNNVTNSGLFSSVENNSSVTKLKLSGFEITGASDAGALAASNSGKISLINVSHTTISGTGNVGSVVGKSEGNGFTTSGSNKVWDTTISGCGSESNVTLSGNATTGGIVGNASGSFMGNNYFTGVLAGNNPGGIVGALSDGNNAVVNSYSTNESIPIVAQKSSSDFDAGNYTTLPDQFVNYTGSGTWDFTNLWEEQSGWPTFRPNAVIISDGIVVPSPTPSQLTIYTVLFNTNGGNSVGNIQITGGNSFTTEGKTLPIPTKKKYLFGGWFTDGDFTQSFDNNTVVSSNLVAFAKWIDNFYNVSFVSNGGTQVNSIKITKDATFSADGESLPRTEKENASFIGWFLDEEQSVMFGLNTKVSSDMVVYAGWQEETQAVNYLVTFDSTEGTFVGPIEIPQGKSFEETGVLLPQPSKEGYDFLGWYVDEQLTQAFTPTTVVEGDLTLHAKWDTSSIYTDIDNLKKSFAADLADDGMYNNVYNISANIDFAGTSWTPIGSANQPFNGQFNFDGEMSNVKIVATPANPYVGFFGVIGQNGEVNGLVLRDISVDVASIDNPVVGLVAGVSLGKVQNCVVDNSINSGAKVKVAGNAIVGGLVGENHNIISNSEVNTSINVEAANAIVGGAVGILADGDVNKVTYQAGNGATIDVATTGELFSCAGGVIGEIKDGTLQHSKSNAKITLANENSDELFVGGVVGVIANSASKHEQANVFACEANGVNISGKIAGGLVGWVSTSDEEMFDCVTDSIASGQVNGEEKAGGLVGTIVRGNMVRCITNCELSGGVVAGIAVDILRQSDSDIASVEDCLAYITIGEHDKAYYSTESRVFKVTNDWVPSFLTWLIKQEKYAGYLENCLIVDNFGADKQYGMQLGTPTTPIVGVINFDSSTKDKEILIDEGDVAKADTYNSLGFSEDIWDIADGKIPTLK